MALEKDEQYRRRTSRMQRQKRRKRIRMLKIAGIAGAAVLVLALLLIFLLPKVLPNSDNTLSTAPSTDTTPPPEDTVIHLVAGGDINITDKTVAAGLTDGGYNYTEVFRDVLPVLSSGDVAVLNFDGILSGNTYGTATKSAPPELLTALKNAGVDILQTANSYSIYDGLRGLNSTLQGVRNAGMTPLGTYGTTAEFNESGGYLIWDIQGIKVAFIAFTKGMDGMGLPSGSEDCVNLLYKDYNSTYQKVDTAGITRVVRNAAAHKPDVMVALLHWGSEYNDQISSSQKKICTLLQNEGVDAIIGTHSHYVQKMEFDPASGSFVAYSLGDFYGDGDVAGTNYSVLLDLEITRDGATGEAKITGFDYVPIFINSDPDGKIQVLRMREAIQGYENQYLGTVSEEEYQAMVSAMERIKDRIGIEN